MDNLKLYDNLPDELKTLPRWVNWCGDKIPHDPHTGRAAKSNDPKTWGTFREAIDALEKYHMDGIGLMFAPPYFGVDLDHCNTDCADEFVESLDSYAEYSRSGEGIHIICRGELPPGARRRGNVEMYASGRYFICTGKVYGVPRTIKDCTETIKPLRAKYLPETRPLGLQQEVTSIAMTDEQVIDKARNCKTGALFQNLYAGDWEGLYPSQSEAELALCNFLAFWTQRNAEQIDRIYRASGLYRKKWETKRGSSTYGALTVAKACANCATVYDPKPGVDDASIAIAFFKDGKVGTQTTREYDADDTGNAQRFRDKFAGRMHYSFTRKKWYFWTGHVWRMDETGEVKRCADTVIADLKREALNEEDEGVQKAKLRFSAISASSTRKEAFIKETQHLDEIPIVQAQTDAQTEHLNTQNGIVNLRNGELIDSDPHMLCTKITHTEYDASHEKPLRWLRFLDDVTAGNKELQRYLQKAVGYSLTGSVEEQCLFILHGIGRNGKSVFLDTIKEIAGDYGKNIQPETIMVRKDTGINSDIARLQGARIVTCEEPTEGVRLNEGLVKQLTGGGLVTCRYLYGDEFEYSPEFKLWIATNHKPVIRGSDLGIWRRIKMIPFTVVIPDEKVDKNLRYKLIPEYPQILSWAVEGCLMWRREGLKTPPGVQEAIDNYKREMDIIAVFADECLELTNNDADQVTTAQLYACFRDWARRGNEWEMSSRKFSEEMKKKGIVIHHTRNGNMYQGLKIKPLYTAEQFS